MRRRSWIVIAGVIAAVTLTAGVASAGGATKPKLSFTKGGKGTSVAWTSEVGSSPNGSLLADNGGQSLKIVVPTVANAGVSAYTYGPDETLVDIRGRRLDQITHLGYDVRGATAGTRISLGLDNGVFLFLSTGSCGVSLGGGWVRADFINDASCGFTDSNGASYANWAAAETAFPTETVVASPSDWFLIQDEPTVGPLYVDRLSVQNWCWIGNGTNGTVNSNSGICA